jgi:ABC-2 type transport system permease protein
MVPLCGREALQVEALVKDKAMQQILYILRKEFQQILRDRFMLAVLFVVPIVQLFILAYAITTDVKHLSTVICDLDRSAASRELVEAFHHSGYFDLNHFTSRQKDIKRYLDAEKAVIGLVIPVNFSRELKSGTSPNVQILLDGQNSNSSVIAMGYSQRIIQQFMMQKLKDTLRKNPDVAEMIHQVEPETRVWYNPNLKSAYYMIPGIIALLLTMITALLTSLAIVREREIGTLEQLMVTPIRPYQLILGKIIPFAVLGYIEFSIAMVIAVIWWRIPFIGSIPTLAAYIAAYILTTLGLGVFISTTVKTQQQALFFCWFFIIFALLMSGFFFPIENMPESLQYLTYLDPLRYFISVMRELILKGAGFKQMWQEMAALIIFGAVIFSLSVLRFQKRIS